MIEFTKEELNLIHKSVIEFKNYLENYIKLHPEMKDNISPKLNDIIKKIEVIMNEPEIILCKYLTELKASKDYIGCCGVMAGCIQKILEYLAEKETNSNLSFSSTPEPQNEADVTPLSSQ